MRFMEQARAKQKGQLLFSDLRPISSKEAQAILQKHSKGHKQLRMTGVEMTYETIQKAVAEMIAKSVIRVIFVRTPRFYKKRRTRSMKGK